MKPAIFITGAAAGIGRATAELFASRGWFVGLYDDNETAVRALAEQLGPSQCVAARLDTTDAAAFAAALANFFKSAGGRLDVLFNNAGIAFVDDFEKLSLEQHLRTVDVNIKGVINGCYQALPYLQQTPGARVISMASASAMYGTPGFAVYSSSKFAVRGLTEALNIEWACHGILVTDLMPLFVATPMVASMKPETQSIKLLGVRWTAAQIAERVWRVATVPRWLVPVHVLPGVQTRFTALLVRLLPTRIYRTFMRVISGY